MRRSAYHQINQQGKLSDLNIDIISNIIEFLPNTQLLECRTISKYINEHIRTQCIPFRTWKTLQTHQPPEYFSEITSIEYGVGFDMDGSVFKNVKHFKKSQVDIRPPITVRISDCYTIISNCCRRCDDDAMAMFMMFAGLIFMCLIICYDVFIIVAWLFGRLMSDSEYFLLKIQLTVVGIVVAVSVVIMIVIEFIQRCTEYIRTQQNSYQQQLTSVIVLK